MRSSTIRLRAGLAALTLVAGFGALAAVAAPADAATTTRYVATNGDDTENDCTNSAKPCQHVQYAVDQAAAGDTVQVAKGEYQETVRIRIPLTLQGAGATGANKTIIDGDHDGDASIIIDGVDVNQTVAVTVKDVAVDGNPDANGINIQGDATLDLIDSSSSNNHGLGVAADGDAATVTGSTVSGNQSAGIEVSTGTLHITGSVIDNNQGASESSGFFGAGVAVLGGAATIDNSTVSNNGSVGIYVFMLNRGLAKAGTTFVPNVTAAITGTTVAGNAEIGVAVGPGAATTIDKSTLANNFGAGIYAEQSSTVVTNTTINGTKAFSANKSLADQGGVVYLTSGPTNEARMRSAARFPSSTSGSAASGTRRPAVAPAEATAGVQLLGTIVADQTASLADCNGNITDNGYNLSSDKNNSCKFTAAQHDQVSTDPLLGPLADNGGPTMTELLKKLSPAIDAIPAGAANCTTSATDQRGVARPQPTGGKCDVGAVELAAKPLAIHPDSLPHGKVGTAYHATITATGGQYPTYTFAFVSGTLPDGLTFTSHGKISGTPTKAGTFHFTVSVNDPVLKAYTIVITDAGSGTAPVSNTGVHTGSMLAIGGGAVAAGILLLLWVGVLDRKARGPRMVYGRHHKG